MRAIPIFTFVNKLDRYGRAPQDLMDELEPVLGIRAYPKNWPIGMGPEFRGVYDRSARVVHVFSSAGTHGEAEVGERSVSLDSEEISRVLTPAELAQLREDVELLDVGGDAFSREKSDRGEITPMFFGSAMTNLASGPFSTPSSTSRPPRAAQHRPGPSRPPPRSSAASSSRSRRTWTRPTATGSPSSAWSPAGT
jgi:peptide chain release factor 3